MSKGLEALKELIKDLLIYKGDYEELSIHQKENKSIIEKELNVLEIFKNALTIEHHELLPVEINKNETDIGLLVKNIATIRQNKLDNELRKELREWVLKNAFPKELKALEELRKAFDSLVKENEKIGKMLSKEIEKNRALEIVKNKQVNVAYFVLCLCLNDYNKYHSKKFQLTQEEYDLLKEVLL